MTAEKVFDGLSIRAQMYVLHECLDISVDLLKQIMLQYAEKGSRLTYGDMMYEVKDEVKRYLEPLIRQASKRKS